MNINSEFYQMIFKRKSFHLFRDTGDLDISAAEIQKIYETYSTLVPLYPDIKTAIRILPAGETGCRRGEQYCIMMYSEKKDNYLRNIGYLGEQLDLYLVSQNIGTLWYGIGKPDRPVVYGLDFVIMLAVSKIDDEKKFRKDMFRSKRKTPEEIWSGAHIQGITEIVRFAPSACNTQPWMVENSHGIMNVYRIKKEGKRGIMPASKVSFYNQIDMGIFLCFLDLCLQHNKIGYQVTLHTDPGSDAQKTKTATYRIL